MLNQIKTQDDCEIALDRVYKLMQINIDPNSKESEELENLSILIKEFESKAYKLPKKLQGSGLAKISTIKKRMVLNNHPPNKRQD